MEIILTYLKMLFKCQRKNISTLKIKLTWTHIGDLTFSFQNQIVPFVDVGIWTGEWGQAAGR